MSEFNLYKQLPTEPDSYRFQDGRLIEERFGGYSFTEPLGNHSYRIFCAPDGSEIVRDDNAHNKMRLNGEPLLPHQCAGYLAMKYPKVLKPLSGWIEVVKL